MPTIFAANESTVMVEGQPVEGVVSLEYRRRQVRSNVYALGTAERIGMVSGPQDVDARLTVASTSPGLDGVPPEKAFQVIANLKQGATTLTVTLDECFLTEKGFSLSAGDRGHSVYSFTAARVTEKTG
ncbi:MAG TPA: hypothetical protein VLA98_06005 [Solirubrobacteraceae bacterium]|nr:hypothetical protein [Solirubrobacteraceae bacterium]HSD81300.1 hypothetical protein [Solirubrobacteraceae bacterium]